MNPHSVFVPFIKNGEVEKLLTTFPLGTGCAKRNIITTRWIPMIFRDFVIPDISSIATHLFWFWLKYLDSYRMNIYDIWRGYSRSPEDEFFWLWWFPDLFSSATSMSIFLVQSETSQQLDSFAADFHCSHFSHELNVLQPYSTLCL